MKKLTSKKGFTLMEMIIVVAIIAILAVVTVPTLTKNTDSAEKAADAANLRSAKAAYQVQMLNKETVGNGYVYDLAQGKFVASTDAVIAANRCGQCSKHNPTGGAAYITVASGGVIQWSDTSTDCK